MNELEQRIHNEIAKKGGIPFSRFMEMALYEPGLGYYETHREVGRGGDFYTNVSVGSLFGELLAFQFADWLAEMDGPVQLVEAGAHDGQLARDVMTYLRDLRPAIYQRCELVLWEPSSLHRKWQAETLCDFESKVNWAKEGGAFRGVFYCNELLDACPVDRFIWNQEQQRWNLSVIHSNEGNFEWGVQHLPNESKPKRYGLLDLETEIAPEKIPDGFVYVSGDYEIWESMSDALKEGRALAVDYWTSPKQAIEAPTKNGSLRGYFQHHLVEDVLERPGQIDITASVNEAFLNARTSLGGLERKPLARQSCFLVGILEQTMKRPEQFPEWTDERTRQFQTLVHPEHLGHSFNVLECWRP